MKAPFRIAIRAEGPMICAYVAKLGTMDDAHLVGSISRAFCDARPEIFQRFQELLQEGAAVLVQEVFGVEVEAFQVEPGPEHERMGNA